MWTVFIQRAIAQHRENNRREEKRREERREEKRKEENTGMASKLPVAAVILDIEGTTTSISFVADVLFPFARREMKGYLEAHWGEPQVVEALAGLDALATRFGFGFDRRC